MKLCRSLVSPSLAVKSREKTLVHWDDSDSVACPLEYPPRMKHASAFPTHNNMPHFELALTKSLLKIIMNQGRRFNFDTGDSYFYHC